MSVKQYLDYAGLQRLVENIDKKYAPIAAIIFKSTVEDIAHLPALNTVQAGWMYNVTTGGGTTSDFIEGAGHVLADGENVAAVELITGYTAVATPQSTDDPKALGWYEVDGTPEAVTPVGTENPHDLGWYEKSGDVYVLTADVAVDGSKTYYTVNFKTSADRIPDVTKVYYTVDTIKKWDTLGGLFDLEGKYLEFGNEFPQGPESRMVDGRTFLYMGDTKKVYTLVASPSGRPSEEGYFEGTFTVASTTDIVNPKQEPLYEVNATAYVEVTPVANPKDEGLYEEDGSGNYVLTEDTTPASGKAYYKQVVSYVRTEDTTVQDGKTYYDGSFAASTDTTVDNTKVYYTEEALYTKAAIYKYDETNEEWVAQSSGGDGEFVPITIKEIDDLFL